MWRWSLWLCRLSRPRRSSLVEPALLHTSLMRLVVGTLKTVGRRFSLFNSLITRFLSHSEDVKPSREACCSTTSLIWGVTRVVSRAAFVSESVLGISLSSSTFPNTISWKYSNSGISYLVLVGHLRMVGATHLQDATHPPEPPPLIEAGK